MCMTYLGGTYECRHHPVTGEYGLLIWDIPLFNFTYPKDFIFRPYRPGAVTPWGRDIQETLPIPVVRAEYVWLPAWERPCEYMYYNPRGDGYIQNPPTGDRRPDSRRGYHFQMDERFEFIRRAGFPSMLNLEQPDSSLPPPVTETPTRAAEATSSRTEILVGLLQAALREVGPPVDQPVSGLHPSGIEPAVSSGGGGNIHAMEGRSQPP